MSDIKKDAEQVSEGSNEVEQQLMWMAKFCPFCGKEIDHCSDHCECFHTDECPLASVEVAQGLPQEIATLRTQRDALKAALEELCAHTLNLAMDADDGEGVLLIESARALLASMEVSDE